MARTRACPSVAELHEALQGRKDVAEVERLTRHLEQCPQCLEKAEVALAADTLLAAVQEPTATEESQADRDCIRKLIAQLKKMRPRSGEAGTDNRTAALSPGDAAQAPAGDSDFLAPPRGGDELGWLGPYRVLKVLGVGGMGIVFLAEDDHLKRRVALKAMKPALAASASSRQRFLREARAAAAIEHDHIVAIYQVGEDRGVPFLAMQFLQGESLDDRLKREEMLPLPEVLRIVRETAEGLGAAHERGLIHRDIKPANLWLEGSRARVKIVDFGLARAANDDAHLTQGGIVGTPAYMAPEQARGEKVDHRCDLFSLGCTLYRLATGQMPFQGRDTMSTLLAVTSQEPRPPAEINPQLPPSISALILRLLAKDPQQRMKSAQKVVAAIEAIEKDLTKAPMAELGKKQRQHGKQTPTGPGQSGEVPAAKRKEAGNAGGARTAKGKQPAQPVRRWPWVLAAVVGVVLLGTFAILGALLIRFGGAKGELVVNVNDPNVELVVRQNNLVIFDRTKGRQFQLAPGDGELEVYDPGTGARFATRQFTITRAGKTMIEVHFEKTPPPKLQPAEAALEGEWLGVDLVDSGLVWPAEKAKQRRMLIQGSQYELHSGSLHVYGELLCDPRQQPKHFQFSVQKGGSSDVQGKLQLGIYESNGQVMKFCVGPPGGPRPVAYDGTIKGYSLQTYQIASAAAAEPDPRAAALVLKRKGKLIAQADTGSPVAITELDKLPPGARLVEIELFRADPVKDDDLVALRGLASLRTLKLMGQSVTDASLEHLADLKNLEFLGLDHTCITGAGLERLPRFGQLHTLDIGDIQLADDDLQRLPPLPKLRTLSLAGTGVTDAGLQTLVHRPIQFLALQHTEITDAAVPTLAKMTTLTRLTLEGTRLTPAGVAQLKKLLPNASIRTDPVQAGAVKGADRRALDLTLSLGGKATIEEPGQPPRVVAGPDPYAFQKLSYRLLKIDLGGNQRLVDAGLMSFRGLDHLGELDLTNTRVSAAAVAALEKALPKCKIIRSP